jgi:hypothetical protein
MSAVAGPEQARRKNVAEPTTRATRRGAEDVEVTR